MSATLPAPRFVLWKRAAIDKRFPTMEDGSATFGIIDHYRRFFRTLLAALRAGPHRQPGRGRWATSPCGGRLRGARRCVGSGGRRVRTISLEIGSSTWGGFAPSPIAPTSVGTSRNGEARPARVPHHTWHGTRGVLLNPLCEDAADLVDVYRDGPRKRIVSLTFHAKGMRPRSSCDRSNAPCLSTLERRVLERSGIPQRTCGRSGRRSSLRVRHVHRNRSDRAAGRRRQRSFADSFGERPMRMAGASQVFGTGAEFHRRRRFGNQIAGARAEDVHAQNAIGLASARIFTKPSMSPSVRARLLARKGKCPCDTLTLSVCNWSSVLPTPATSGWYRPRRNHVVIHVPVSSHKLFDAGHALFFGLVRRHRTADHVANGENAGYHVPNARRPGCRRALATMPTLSRPKPSVLGMRPTETSTRSQRSGSAPSYSTTQTASSQPARVTRRRGGIRGLAS